MYSPVLWDGVYKRALAANWIVKKEMFYSMTHSTHFTVTWRCDLAKCSISVKM